MVEALAPMKRTKGGSVGIAAALFSPDPKTCARVANWST
jgi:hypothetical protein